MATDGADKTFFKVLGTLGLPKAQERSLTSKERQGLIILAPNEERWVPTLGFLARKTVFHFPDI